VTDRPSPSYAGTEPYVFVCYSHEDAALVYEEIRWLQEQGIRVWYDEHITAGEEWSEELGVAIQGADRMVFFVTPKSVLSRHCRNEVGFAQNHGVPVIAVHLAPSSLPPGLELTISSSQGIFAHDLPAPEYRRRLLEVLDRTVESSRSARGEPRPVKALPIVKPAVVSTIVLIGAALLLWWFGGGQPADDLDARAVPRVAVMPFRSSASVSEDVYLGSGLAEEIASALSKFTSLRVIPPSMTARLADSTDLDAARELGVSYLVHGDVRRLPEDFRVSARLIDPHDGIQLWAETYTRSLEMDDVLAVQTEIAREIAATLADATGVVFKAEFSQLSERPTDSFAVYDCVLRSHAYIAIHDDETHLKARDCLEQAVRIDPDYGDAWAHLAYLYEEEFHHNRNLQPRPLERAMEAARKAKELAPDNPWGKFAMAMASFSTGDIDSSLQQFQNMMQLNPNNATALAAYAVTSMYAGELEQGFELIERARALNPTPPAWIYTALGAGYFLQGDYGKALLEISNFGPVFDVQTELFRVAALGKLGRRDEAETALRRLQSRDPAFAEDPDAEFRRYLVVPSTIEAVRDGMKLAGLESR